MDVNLIIFDSNGYIGKGWNEAEPRLQELVKKTGGTYTEV